MNNVFYRDRYGNRSRITLYKIQKNKKNFFGLKNIVSLFLSIFERVAGIFFHNYDVK